ncbi:MAG: SDR family NAD(P)-dependent oxidoreductase [Woeseiaceae bacterium]|nr:SDR family NAD(P)-dependent oxidoreductase [Woeseiaceae bacterium]
MNGLTSFTDSANVAVIGASGGIGNAFCDALAEDPAVGKVFAFSRRTLERDGNGLTWQPIDIEDENTIERAADSVGETPLDLVLVLTGILHEGELRPERRMSELAPDSIARVFAINTIGPTLVAKHFLPKLRRDAKTVFAALSARVGSIGDNRLGGWASYRASKAALNQFVRTLSIEHARRRPKSVVVSLHPGTVRTSLSEPFTARTPAEKLFTPEQSAGYLLEVIDRLGPDDTGGFFAWDGTRIEY